jgi:hypothetical protein
MRCSESQLLTLRKYMYLVAIKQQSVFKLLVKLARIIIGIVQRGETFSPEKATPNFTQAA